MFLHFDDELIRLDAGIVDFRKCDKFYLSHQHCDHTACINSVVTTEKITTSDIICSHCNTNGVSIDCYGYFIKDQVLFITDTGKIPSFPANFPFNKVKYCIIECNYNKLWTNHFKNSIPVYQLRAIGLNGHLSDIDCISFIIDYLPRTCTILLVHETTNTVTIPNYDMFSALPNNVVKMSQPNKVYMRPDGRVVS